MRPGIGPLAPPSSVMYKRLTGLQGRAASDLWMANRGNQVLLVLFLLSPGALPRRIDEVA